MRLCEIFFSKSLPKLGKYSKDYSNLPDRYIKRAMRQIEWQNPKGLQYRPNTTIERRKFRFDVNRPWTSEFYDLNAPGRYHSKLFVEPLRKWSWFRGDRVEILVGKDKGKQGHIKLIVEERNWVLVDGLNCKLEKIGERKNFDGVWVKREQPLLVTDQVALVDPSDLRATTIEWRFTENGEEVRVSTRTGRIIPMPASAEETYDYKNRHTYKEQLKDTKADDVIKITFQPELETFEMDLMKQIGIEDNRLSPKTYWY